MIYAWHFEEFPIHFQAARRTKIRIGRHLRWIVPGRSTRKEEKSNERLASVKWTKLAVGELPASLEILTRDLLKSLPGVKARLEFKNIPMERRLEGKRRSPCSLFITSHGIAERQRDRDREREREEEEEKKEKFSRQKRIEGKKKKKEKGNREKRREEGGEKSFPRRINFLDLWPRPCSSARFYQTASFHERMNLPGNATFSNHRITNCLRATKISPRPPPSSFRFNCGELPANLPTPESRIEKNVCLAIETNFSTSLPLWNKPVKFWRIFIETVYYNTYFKWCDNCIQYC